MYLGASIDTVIDKATDVSGVDKVAQEREQIGDVNLAVDAGATGMELCEDLQGWPGTGLRDITKSRRRQVC